MDGGVYNLVFGKLTRIKKGKEFGLSSTYLYYPKPVKLKIQFWIKISRRYVYEFIESICFHNT